jgi:hypothetical protein
MFRGTGAPGALWGGSGLQIVISTEDSMLVSHF